MKICPNAQNITKLGLQFGKIPNNHAKNCQRFSEFCQNGKISQNLVTLRLGTRSALFLSFILRKRFFRIGHSHLFSFIFSHYYKNITNITSHNWEKCPSSICCWDPNPQPIEHESLPITTRTGLPPYGKDFCSLNMFCYVLGWSVIL